MGRTPYSDAAKAAIIAIQTSNTDVMTAKDGPMTQAEKIQRLTQMTYKQYLQYYWSCPDDAFFGEYWRGSGSLLGAGGQAVSAADCWVLGRPGFPSALGLPSTTDVVFPGIGRTPQQDSKSGSGPTRAWPDGNISLLKLIVGKLIPGGAARCERRAADAAHGPAVEDELQRPRRPGQQRPHPAEQHGLRGRARREHGASRR